METDTGTETGAGTGEGTETGEETGAGGSENKTFTQAELDDIVKKRLARVPGIKPEDLGFKTKAELEAALAEHKKFKDDSQSEQEKAIEDAKKAGRDEATAEVLGKANARLVRSEFFSEAKDRNVIDPAALYLIAKGEGLLDSLAVTDSDEVDGMDDEFWEGLLKERSYLVKPGDGSGDGKGEEQSGRTPGNANTGGGKPRVKMPENRQEELKAKYPALNRR